LTEFSLKPALIRLKAHEKAVVTPEKRRHIRMFGGVSDEALHLSI
jgi:hypothetical protein